MLLMRKLAFDHYIVKHYRFPYSS